MPAHPTETELRKRDLETKIEGLRTQIRELDRVTPHPDRARYRAAIRTLPKLRAALRAATDELESAKADITAAREARARHELARAQGAAIARDYTEATGRPASGPRFERYRALVLELARTEDLREGLIQGLRLLRSAHSSLESAIEAAGGSRDMAGARRLRRHRHSRRRQAHAP